jgi:putative MATE family efflux protein
LRLSPRLLGRAFIILFHDREYFIQLAHIAGPIALQNLFSSAINMVGGVMIGQMGDASIAGVGLANQVFFLFNLLIFGITSGSAIFTAQLWGKRDIPNIRRVLALCLLLGLSSSLVFLVLSQISPQTALRLFTADRAVIALGGDYLRTAGWSLAFLAITLSYAAVLRSTGDVRTPMLVSTGALGLNIFLSYGLIFGNFGLPRLEIQGAALAVLISRGMECAALLWLTYRKHASGLPSPAAVQLHDLASLELSFARKVLGPVLPVALNELLWALGIAIYNAVYAHIGTQAYAAINILGAIDGLAFVVFLAVGNACAIMVGNQIGSGDERLAYRTAGQSRGVVMLGGIGVGGILLITAPVIFGLYKVSPEVINYVRKLILVLACFVWIRAANHTLIIGVMRSGGDTRFSFLIDVGGVWLVGIPMALLGAFGLHLPIYWVYLMVMSDEVSKLILGMWRFFSHKWIHNLAERI